MIHAGLLLFDKLDNVCLLRRDKPYKLLQSTIKPTEIQLSDKLKTTNPISTFLHSDRGSNLKSEILLPITTPVAITTVNNITSSRRRQFPDSCKIVNSSKFDKLNRTKYTVENVKDFTEDGTFQELNINESTNEKNEKKQNEYVSKYEKNLSNFNIKSSFLFKKNETNVDDRGETDIIDLQSEPINDLKELENNKELKEKRRSEYDPFYNKIFLEKFQIPRGEAEQSDLNPIHTAVREFIEETRINLEKIYISDSLFDLYWTDDGRIWEYKIFIGYLDSCFNEERNISEKNYYHEKKVDLLKYYINKRKQRKMLFENKNRKVIYTEFKVYKKIMLESQLTCYSYNNYKEFINFAENAIGDIRLKIKNMNLSNKSTVLIDNPKKYYTKPPPFSSFQTNNSNSNCYNNNYNNMNNHYTNVNVEFELNIYQNNIRLIIVI